MPVVARIFDEVHVPGFPYQTQALGSISNVLFPRKLQAVFQSLTASKQGKNFIDLFARLSGTFQRVELNWLLTDPLLLEIKTLYRGSI